MHGHYINMGTQTSSRIHVVANSMVCSAMRFLCVLDYRESMSMISDVILSLFTTDIKVQKLIDQN